MEFFLSLGFQFTPPQILPAGWIRSCSKFENIKWSAIQIDYQSFKVKDSTILKVWQHPKDPYFACYMTTKRNESIPINIQEKEQSYFTIPSFASTNRKESMQEETFNLLIFRTLEM